MYIAVLTSVATAKRRQATFPDIIIDSRARKIKLRDRLLV